MLEENLVVLNNYWTVIPLIEVGQFAFHPAMLLGGYVLGVASVLLVVRYSGRFELLRGKQITQIDHIHDELLMSVDLGRSTKKKISKLHYETSNGNIVTAERRDRLEDGIESFVHELTGGEQPDTLTELDFGDQLNRLEKLARKNRLRYVPERGPTNESEAIEVKIGDVYHKHARFEKDEPAHTAEEQLERIETELEHAGKVREGIDTLYAEYVVENPGTRPLQKLDKIENKLGELQDRIDEIYESLDKEDQSDPTAQLDGIETWIENAWEFKRGVEDCLSHVERRERHAEPGDGRSQHVDTLLTGIKKLGEGPRSNYELIETVHRLQDYEHVLQTLAEILDSDWENERDLRQIETQLSEKEEVNELSRAVALLVGKLRDSRDSIQSRKELEQKLTTAKDQLTTAKGLVETIAQGIDIEAIDGANPESDVEWLDSLERVAAGVENGEIGPRRVPSAATPVQEASVESTPAGEALLTALAKPDQYSDSELQAKIHEAIAELGDLATRVRTVREQTATIGQNLALDELTTLDPADEYGWIEILEGTAKAVENDLIGIQRIRDAATDVQSEHSNISDDTELLDRLANPERYDRSDLRATLETTMNRLAQYREITGNGAKELDTKTVKLTAARLKRDMPDLEPSNYEKQIADHITAREEELDRIDESEFMRKYAIYQELTGLETLVDELASSA